MAFEDIFLRYTYLSVVGVEKVEIPIKIKITGFQFKLKTGSHLMSFHNLKNNNK